MTERDTTYNGWTNWETWLVNLWIDNDGYAGGSLGVSEEADRIVEQALNDNEQHEALEESVGTLADWIEERLNEDLKVDEAKGLLLDILSGTLGSVNWYEIAKHYCEDALNDAIANKA